MCYKPFELNSKCICTFTNSFPSPISSIMSMTAAGAATQTIAEYKPWGRNCKGAGRKRELAGLRATKWPGTPSFVLIIGVKLSQSMTATSSLSACCISTPLWASREARHFFCLRTNCHYLAYAKFKAMLTPAISNWARKHVGFVTPLWGTSIIAPYCFKTKLMCPQTTLFLLQMKKK